MENMIQLTGLMQNSKALFSGKYIEYITPKKLFNGLNDEFHFVLDPCTTNDNPLNTPYFFTKENDGLSQSWNYDGAVYVNPPYGNEIINWIKKSYEESRKGCTVVMLLPARTDTKWFHEYVYNKAEVRFLRGR